MKSIYSIQRKVILGKKLARTFGFPTANLKYYKRDQKLKNGVYIANLKISKKKYYGLSFVGKPKVIKKDNKIIEIFVFQYKGNLYNKTIKVNFIKRIRGVKNFNNFKELNKEIKQDIIKANKYLKNV